MLFVSWLTIRSISGDCSIHTREFKINGGCYLMVSRIRIGNHKPTIRYRLEIKRVDNSWRSQEIERYQASYLLTN